MTVTTRNPFAAHAAAADLAAWRTNHPATDWFTADRDALDTALADQHARALELAADYTSWLAALRKDVWESDWRADPHHNDLP